MISLEKPCSVCKVVKPIEQFNRRSNRPGGRNYHCRSCQSEKVSRARRTPEYRAARNLRGKSTMERAGDARWLRAWKVRNPEKIRAHQEVARAKKLGILVPQPCPCGVVKVHAHHHRGYDEAHWLDVEWLCSTCHAREHHGPELT